MARRVLVLGSTGKMGTALMSAFKDGYEVTGLNSRDFDAAEMGSIGGLIERHGPDIVINTVAFLGIDPCEKEPERAFRMNTLYPRELARLSERMGFTLTHFSTDAVFNDSKEGFYTEDDAPAPLNLYGATKYAGDCMIQSIARSYYIFRISVLFGRTPKVTQFVEKMVQKVKEGQKVLSIADDIVSSPTYSVDVAGEVRRVMEAGSPHGLYHVANEGSGTLYELMREIVEVLGLDVEVRAASFRDFPYVGRKNTRTPIKSNKLKPLRHWKEAVRAYCEEGQ